MADVFSKAKRSEVMSRIRSRGNKATEVVLAALFRRHKITGWRRQRKLIVRKLMVDRRRGGRVQIGGRDGPPGRPRPQRSEGRNERGKIRVPAVRSRRLTLRSATGTAQRTVPTFRVRPDFVFPKSRTAVFVDGCFWHGCPRHGTQPKGNRAFWKNKLANNKARDRRVNRALRRAGWRVVRIWECRLAKIEKFLENHQKQQVLMRLLRFSRQN